MANYKWLSLLSTPLPSHVKHLSSNRMGSRIASKRLTKGTSLAFNSATPLPRLTKAPCSQYYHRDSARPAPNSPLIPTLRSWSTSRTVECLQVSEEERCRPHGHDLMIRRNRVRAAAGESVERQAFELRLSEHKQAEDLSEWILSISLLDSVYDGGEPPLMRSTRGREELMRRVQRFLRWSVSRAFPRSLGEPSLARLTPDRRLQRFRFSAQYPIDVRPSCFLHVS